MLDKLHETAIEKYNYNYFYMLIYSNNFHKYVFIFIISYNCKALYLKDFKSMFFCIKESYIWSCCLHMCSYFDDELKLKSK